MWRACVYDKLLWTEADRMSLTSSQLSFVKPFRQNGLQFAGILEAQLQIFKAADRGLAELWTVHCCKSLAYVSLRVAWQSMKQTDTLCRINTSGEAARETSVNNRSIHSKYMGLIHLQLLLME